MGQPEAHAPANDAASFGVRRGQDAETASRSESSGIADHRDPVVEEIQAQRIASYVSGPDDLEAQPTMTNVTSYREPGDEVYGRLSGRRKAIIVAVLSFCAFLSPISSTSILAATPEVAAEYNTTGSIINLSNAGYLAFMALSPLIWGPISQVFGRRPTNLVTAVSFFLLSLATALAPDLGSFFVFRAFSALVGASFILVGSACIGDIYKPVERGTAIGWFLSGTLIGPAFGPFIGGIIVTFSDWRTIFWLQTALTGAGLLMTFFLVPETIHHRKIEDLAHCSRQEKTWAIMRMLNPLRVLFLFQNPSLIMAAGASSALVWNMYSLLTPIRYVLNPRFKLETPMLGGLFYLAPGLGYLLGTFGGGRWADRTVKRWIKKRDGIRVPEDRLRSCLPFLGIAMPGCVLVYGWSVDQAVGGIPLPVIAMFLQGVAQLFCFPSINTYCLDVMPGKGAEVAAANFFVRYLAGVLGTAVVLPAIEGVGVGWFSTLSAGLLALSAVGLLGAIRYGQGWQKKVKDKERAKRAAKRTVETRVEGNQATGAQPKESKEAIPKDATAKEFSESQANDTGIGGSKASKRRS